LACDRDSPPNGFEFLGGNKLGAFSNPFLGNFERCAALCEPNFILALFGNNLVDLLLIRLDLVFDIDANKSKSVGELQDSPRKIGVGMFVVAIHRDRSDEADSLILKGSEMGGGEQIEERRQCVGIFRINGRSAAPPGLSFSPEIGGGCSLGFDVDVRDLGQWPQTRAFRHCYES
jgi:hypothetical protein